MATPARSTHPLIAPGVDAPALFARAQELFAEELQILELVAASPVRVLFAARDRVLKRRVALRVHVEPATPLRRWFERETELLAALDHPVIRPIFSAGSRAEWAYRIAKWIDGESVAAAGGRGARPVPVALQLARDLTNALEYAHSQRIVVRRLPPEVVTIDATQRTFLTDLRYANVCLDVAQPDDDATAVPYLAPEVRDGSAGEPWSDVYGAGALLYFVVTGTPPPADPHAVRSPRELRPACPRALERVILRALQPTPLDRYLTAAEMSDDLLSDLGEFDLPFPVAPQRDAMSEDPRSWEKRLRRALGDDYELLHELGAGGFGRVYLVRDLALEREVALKVLHPYLTADPAVVERFHREARMAAQLIHPNIVNIYDIGGRAGLLWYTMEYVRGTSLDRIVAQAGPLPVDRVTRLVQEALDALALAHRSGVVHRDLKPENLLIEDASGDVRIADFGLALALKGTDRFGGASSHSGTPAFAAPEQLLGEAVDHRADLYALALSAYYALTGAPAFGGGTVEAIVAHQSLGRLPAVREVRDDVPESLLRVLERAAARRPQERFASAEAFAAALREAAHPWRTRLRRAWDALAGSRNEGPAP